MTAGNTTNTNDSMRFSPQEIVSGMLATLEADNFTDEAGALRTVFGRVAGEFPLFAGFAADEAAATKALDVLETKGVLARAGGRYVLSASGRALCVSSKRTLFNRGHVEQLEGAALVFATA
ncbi:MAG: hypothetical protein EXR68_02495 [Dehalococcoidia bacterium]|nr:hypothetical protein [Dehalococcoidia bacterium]